jgi:hypothetical protein
MTEKRNDGNRDYHDGFPPHRIETTVLVYLRLDDEGKGWIVDGPTVDGHPLDDRGVYGDDCPCGGGSEHDAAIAHAQNLMVPSGVDLIDLLLESIGMRINE